MARHLKAHKTNSLKHYLPLIFALLSFILPLTINSILQKKENSLNKTTLNDINSIFNSHNNLTNQLNKAINSPRKYIEIDSNTYLTHYNWPDKLPNTKLLKCAKELGDSIISYTTNKNYTVFIVDKSKDFDIIFLKNNEILIYSNQCELVKKLPAQTDSTSSSNAILGIDLYGPILIVNYHIGPHGGILRRYDIESKKELYFIKYYPPSENINTIPEPIYTKLPSQSHNSTYISRYENKDYKISFKYPNHYNTEEEMPDGNSSAIFSISVTDQTCSSSCAQLFTQNIFTLNVYESLKDLPSYKDSTTLQDYLSTTYKSNLEEEFIEPFVASGQSGSGYLVKTLKVQGVVKLYTMVYMEHNGKIWVINSNIPTASATYYDEEFEEILGNFGFEE